MKLTKEQRELLSEDDIKVFEDLMRKRKKEREKARREYLEKLERESVMAFKVLHALENATGYKVDDRNIENLNYYFQQYAQALARVLQG